MEDASFQKTSISDIMAMKKKKDKTVQAMLGLLFVVSVSMSSLPSLANFLPNDNNPPAMTVAGSRRSKTLKMPREL